MKLLAASILIVLTLSAPLAFTAAPFESCSCSANDGSCSASVNCSGGCFAFCPDNDGCRAICLKNSDGSSHGAIMSMRVTLRFKESSSREVSDVLARVTGEDVMFSPSRADARFNLEVEQLPLWNVLEIISESGRIQIAGDDFSNLRRARRALLDGERISLCAHGTTVRRLVNELRYLTGLNLNVASGDANAVVNYTGRGVTFNEIIAQLAERTGAQIIVK